MNLQKMIAHLSKSWILLLLILSNISIDMHVYYDSKFCFRNVIYRIKHVFIEVTLSILITFWILLSIMLNIDLIYNLLKCYFNTYCKSFKKKWKYYNFYLIFMLNFFISFINNKNLKKKYDDQIEIILFILISIVF